MVGLAQNLSFILLGEDKSASKTMHGAADVAEKTTARIGGAFGKLSSAIGGEFGETLNRVGDGIATVGEKQKKLSTTLVVGGGVATGLGLALQQMGSGHKQAADQLQQAVKNSGHSWGTYKEQVDQAIAKQEGFGHSAVDTQEALRKLTQSTNDPKKALADMSLLANLAAAQHISLSEAADQLSKILIGKGARALTQFGVVLQHTGNATKDLTVAQAGLTKATTVHDAAVLKLSQLEEVQHTKKKLSVADHIALQNAQKNVTKSTEALTVAQEKVTKAQDKTKTSTNAIQDSVDALSKKLDGQAGKSVDNFGGQVGILRTKLGDWAAEMGNTVGPAITAIGPVLMALGAGMQVFSSIQDAVQAKQIAAAAASTAAAAATEAQTGAQVGLNVVMDANPIGLVTAAIVGLAAVVGGALLIGGLDKSTQSTADFTDALKSNSDQIDINIKKVATKALLDSGALKAAEKLGISAGLLVDAATNQAGAQQALDRQIGFVNAGLDKQQAAMTKGSGATADQTRAFNDSWQSLKLLQDQVSSTGQKLTDSQESQDLYTRGIRGIGSAAALTSDQLKAMKDKLDNLPPGVGRGVAGTGLKFYAQGGTTMGPEFAMVGERGPELVKLPGGSRVFPTGQSPSPSKGGGIHIGQIVMQPNQSVAELVQEMGWFSRWAT